MQNQLAELRGLVASLSENNVSNVNNPQNIEGIDDSHNVYMKQQINELKAGVHKDLSEFLDKEAPFGEVFNCTVENAKQAVEARIAKEK